MKLCYVTDRKALPGSAEEQMRLLLEKIESTARAGVNWIQIRDKDLSARELAALTAEALRRIPLACRVLVNDRLDVAIAAGAGGVHLGEHSIPVGEARRLLRDKSVSADFLVGVSVHSLRSAEAAERSGADYVVFGPVFETPSKTAFGSPQGEEKLAQICAGVSIPVMAIGGIGSENAGKCEAAGAAGIAAIRMFQDATDVPALLRRLRGDGKQQS
jgi:thiamine-phosphate pyrophosphorylase